MQLSILAAKIEVEVGLIFRQQIQKKDTSARKWEIRELRVSFRFRDRYSCQIEFNAFKPFLHVSTAKEWYVFWRSIYLCNKMTYEARESLIF